MIVEHRIGVCADPGDIDAIALAMLEIRQLKQESIQEIAQNSVQLLQNTFDRKVNLNKIYNLLNS